MAQKLWAVGEEVLATDFNAYVQNQVVPVFADQSSRDAQWPAPPNGALCVTLNNQTLWQRINGVWLTAGPGAELSYSQINANVTVTGNSAAAAQTVIGGVSTNYDGSQIMLEFFTPGVLSSGIATGSSALSLWDGNTDLGIIATLYVNTATQIQVPVFARRRLLPASGPHTYNIRGFVAPSGSAIVVAGAGGGPNINQPAYLRITRA